MFNPFEHTDGFILPETDDRPIRPDLPWLRNLSWTKLHAMQIGFGIALIVYLALSMGEEGVALGLLVLAAQAAFGELQEHSDSLCEHDIGIHDFIEKPWYALSSGVATYVALGILWGWPYVV